MAVGIFITCFTVVGAVFCSLIPTTATWHKSQCCVFKDLSIYCTSFLWEFLYTRTSCNVTLQALAYRVVQGWPRHPFLTVNRKCATIMKLSQLFTSPRAHFATVAIVFAVWFIHTKGAASQFELAQGHILQPGERVRKIHWCLLAALSTTEIKHILGSVTLFTTPYLQFSKNFSWIDNVVLQIWLHVGAS